MLRPKVMCHDCPHPRDQHSVYRPKCLINGCPCTRSGGHQYALDAQYGEN